MRHRRGRTASTSGSRPRPPGRCRRRRACRGATSDEHEVVPSCFNDDLFRLQSLGHQSRIGQPDSSFADEQAVFEQRRIGGDRKLAAGHETQEERQFIRRPFFRCGGVRSQDDPCHRPASLGDLHIGERSRRKSQDHQRSRKDACRDPNGPYFFSHAEILTHIQVELARPIFRLDRPA